ncbi:carbamoyl-phosphate synthase small chain [Bacilli bacterium]|nr:carbamoyl-phosphate synthase small chain [Bacilli bacterium]
MFCHELCDKPSNFRNQISLNDFLIKNKIPGLQGVNTRAVVSILRDNGVIKAKLTSNISNINDTINEIKNYKPKNPLDFVTVKKSTTINPKGKYIIALYDFGVKQNIVRELVKRNCKVIIFPPESTYEDMMKIKPNGFVISNGPCDPKDNVFQIKQIKKIYDADIPMLGICLGHQMIALSVGFNTIKLPYGHRAVNHPCKYINGHTYLTTQNHGYNVDESSINSKIATVSFTNLNDKTIEGLIYKNKKYIETTQFHPEASSGPLDTGFIFDNFINAIRKEMK